MTINLFDLTYRVASEIGILQEGEATGGSTTTLIDTLNLDQVDDYWNNGTVWFPYGATPATPQGEYTVVSDFDNGTNTATITAVTATTSGIRYAIAKGGKTGYRLDQIITAINRVVQSIHIRTVDTTTVDTAAAQTEYTLPTGINTENIEVWIETIISDADDNQWVKAYNTYIQKTAGGTADTLVFPEQPPYPRDVKLVYGAPHVLLIAYTDKLDEDVHEERIVYKAAYNLLRNFRMREESKDEWLLEAIAELRALAQQAELMYPVPAPKRQGTILDVGNVPTRELAFGENTIP